MIAVMALNPAQTLLLINVWPDRLAAPELVAWGFTCRFKRVSWYNKRFVETAYNAAIKHLALPSSYQEFIFADRDVRPGPETKPFLLADGDVVACEYPVAGNESWDDPQALHTGLFRCRRQVLESIKPPWFERHYSPDGMTEVGCLCQSFRDKVLAAGFQMVRAGKVKRDRSTQWPPPLTQQTAWS